ncbi:MAG: organic hydroperoxide resistance protein [Bdellovibrionales bacterium]|jgi:Ohr subfamily peroxiredoxin|nr:organic hydroperoxide resistance protein [Bdellovibrionales bacterium]
MTVIYTARAAAQGGRGGHTETDDKKLSFDLSPPGSDGPGTNPEQLFAAGYAACFGGALAFLAKQKEITLEGAPVVNVTVNLHKADGGFHLSGAIDVAVKGLDDAVAADLVRATHDFCPYSKATRGNVDIALSVNGKAL